MIIIPFNKKYNQAVIDFILNIQRNEFCLPISLDDQPDLVNITASYQDKEGAFWIALDGDCLVGCIGLVSLKDGNVALKKMFVAPTHRRTGLGRRLVDCFLAYCQENGKKTIYLGTTSKFVAAQRFYREIVFLPIVESELPSDFPLLEVDNRHYCYKIN